MPASIAASMIGTFRSYQELLITESHFFSSRTRDAASRASTETGTARSSRCAPAKAFAFASFLPPIPTRATPGLERSEEHTSELQSHHDLVCRLLLEKKKK